MKTLQRALAGLTLSAFVGVMIPGPALAGGYGYGDDSRVVRQVEYNPWASQSRYSRYAYAEEEYTTEAEAQRKRHTQAMKTLGALAFIALLIGAMSHGSSGSSSYSSDDGYAGRQIDREYQAQEEVRQERQAAEARQQQQNCYGGCPQW